MLSPVPFEQRPAAQAACGLGAVQTIKNPMSNSRDSRHPMPRQQTVLSPALVAVLSELGLGQVRALHDIAVRPIEGHSNLVYAIEAGPRRLACRFLSGRPDGHGADERRASEQAWRLGIGAHPVLIDHRRGIAVTRWIEGAKPVSGRLLRSDVSRLRQAFGLIARFHARALGIRHAIDIGGAVAGAVDKAQNQKVLPSFWQEMARPYARALRRLENARTLAPSHGDPTPGNFLEAGGRLRLIDWEYAGLAPAAWDFGYLAFEAGMDAREACRVLASVQTGHNTSRGPLRCADIADAMFIAGILNTIWYVRAAGDGAPPDEEPDFRWRRLRLLARQLPGTWR